MNKEEVIKEINNILCEPDIDCHPDWRRSYAEKIYDLVINNLPKVQAGRMQGEY